MLTFLEGTHGYPGGNKYKQNYNFFSSKIDFLKSNFFEFFILFDDNAWHFSWAFIKSLNTTLSWVILKSKKSSKKSKLKSIKIKSVSKQEIKK